MTPSPFDCDVLVVGGGPTGSATALFLAQRGLRVIVADREADIYPLPRAAHIDHEAVRIFQALGLADQVMASCRQAARYDFINRAGDVLLRFDGADRIAAGGWPAANMIHQPSIDRVLRDTLQQTDGIELRTLSRLVALDQDADGVTARFATEDGESSVRARYLIGADGTRSTTRTLAGIDLDDLCFDEPWLVIDALVQDASRLPTINLQICDPERPTTCALMGSGRHRWEFMLRPDETPEQAVEPDFVAALLAPWKVDGAVEVERVAVYRFNARVACQWRKGRVLLAGDSAHQMPPFAGQGMCSGLRDAANLGWKLPLVLSGDADAALLDTYQQEREPHVRTIIALAMMMGRTVCEMDPEAAAARDVQMIAARANGSQPVPASVGFDHGFVLAGASGAGTYFPQLAGEDGTLARLDDALGPDAWLIRGDRDAGDLAPLPGVRDVALSDLTLAAFAPALTRWMESHGHRAVIVRADRYVFGGGDPDELARAWRVQLAGTATADQPTSHSTKESNMSVDGTYDVTVKSPMGDQTSKLTVKADGDAFTGTNVGAAGTHEIAGSVSGNTLTWEQKITVPMPMTLDMTATIDGDAVSGSVKAGAFGSFPLTGARAA